MDKIVSENGKVEITEYTLHGKLITHLTKRVADQEDVETGRDELHFFYDAQSRPAFVEYNRVKYRYIHNLQGDIVAIIDSVGNPVVEYKYDAWGNPPNSITYTDIGDLNPFRYRGYVWDDESKLYYLRSRYYIQSQGRFINPDILIISGGRFCGCNQFKYCSNNVVRKKDANGCREIDAFSVQSESAASRSRSCALQNKMAQGDSIANQINKLAGKTVVSGYEIRSYAINEIESDIMKEIKKNMSVNGLKALMIVDMGYGIYVAYGNNSYGTLKRIAYSYETYKLEKSDEIIQSLVKGYELCDILATVTDISNGAFLTESDIVLSEAQGSIVDSIFYGFIDWLTGFELPPTLASQQTILVSGKNDPFIPGNWPCIG